MVAAGVSEHLEAVTGGKRVINVATYRINGDLILLAVVEAAASGARSARTAAGCVHRATRRARRRVANTPQFALASDDIIYFYDQSKGLYRSSNAGQSFSKIWAQPASGQLFGYIAADPVNPGRVYVSQGKTTYRPRRCPHRQRQLRGHGDGSEGAGTPGRPS